MDFAVKLTIFSFNFIVLSISKLRLPMDENISQPIQNAGVGPGQPRRKKKSNWLLWIVLGSLAFCMLSAFLVGLFFVISTRDRAVVESNSVVVLNLSGPLPENMPYVPIDRVFGDREMSLLDVLENIDKARVDDRIRAIVLDIGFMNAGWAKVEEIKSRLDEFRESGKEVLAFLEWGGDKEYYLALSADWIFAAPESYLFIDGLTASALFVKGALDQLGIEAQVESSGEYKTYGDTFSRTKMSAAHGEMITALLDDGDQRYKSAIGRRLEISLDSVRSLIDAGISSGVQAYSIGLVDSLMYRDRVMQFAGRTGKVRMSEISGKAYRRTSPQSLDLQEGRKLAVVYGVGTISEGKDGVDPIFGRVMGSATMARNIGQAADNDDVAAIILRIDSPGGSILGSDLIWHEIIKAREKKPVIASMSDVSASGGYYLAMACDSIVANPSTITGSVGVVSILFSLEKAFDKLGMNIQVIKRGRYADFFSNAKTLNEDERAKFRAQVAAAYERFVAKVAEARGLTVDEVELKARGRVWSGNMARSLGLVDRIGGLDEAVDCVRDMLGIPEDEDPELVVYPRPRKFIEMVLNPDQDLQGWSESPVLGLRLPPDIVRGLELLGRFQSGRPDAVLPFSVQID